MSDEPRTKKARKRPRTKRARQEVRQNIERALASTKSGLAERLKSEGGTLPMQEVLSHVAGADQSDVGKLSAAQLTSLSNASRMFEVAPATNGELRLALKSEERESVQDTFVYVDNLPPSCSEDHLRRRAAVYGTVVDVSLPRVGKLQRRYCTGTEFALNSGFGFVQFTSKVAVRKFCKAYATNSHLNRANHPKTHKKKKTTHTERANSDLELQKLLQMAEAQNKQAPRKRRVTEQSVGEQSVDDSGTESDIPNKPPAPKAPEDKRGKKRKRKRKSEVPKMSLVTFFSKLQVFSLRRYLQLKKEYLALKAENQRRLKEVVQPEAPADVENRHPAQLRGTADGHCSVLTRKRVRSRSCRSRSRLIATAAAIKSASFEKFRMQSD